MIACVSVPWDIRAYAGGLLSHGRPLRTRDAPEVSRCYFLIRVDVGHDTYFAHTHADSIEAHFFWSEPDAAEWGEADIARRLDEGDA